MKKNRSCFLILAMLFVSSLAVAQEEAKETPYWYASSAKVQWENFDSLKTLLTMHQMPIYKQAIKSGRILDAKILLHHTGDEYNVVLMVKHKSWKAITTPGWFAESWKEIEPDEAVRKKVQEQFNHAWAGVTHVDNIYTEVVAKK